MHRFISRLPKIRKSSLPQNVSFRNCLIKPNRTKKKKGQTHGNELHLILEVGLQVRSLFNIQKSEYIRILHPTLFQKVEKPAISFSLGIFFWDARLVTEKNTFINVNVTLGF